MTMLDRMRRHKNWLKWSLAIVVVAWFAAWQLILIRIYVLWGFAG